METVLRKYEEFARLINDDIRVIKGDTDWSCFPDYGLIEIPQITTEQGTKQFLNSVRKKLPKSQKNLIEQLPDFMWCFLHEIGHIQCDHLNNSGESLRYFANRLGILGLEKISCLIYYNLKDEKQATQWAVDFALSNLKLVKRYSKKLQSKYNKYYVKLGVVE